ncbi:MAG: hypothetical protein WC356_05095 [Candidatus Micrarchaeia archaeon]|jgi:hypothetical protein
MKRLILVLMVACLLAAPSMGSYRYVFGNVTADSVVLIHSFAGLDDTVGVWTSTNSVDTTITGGIVDFSGTHVWIQRILYTTGGNWVAGTEIVSVASGIDDNGTVSLSYYAADTGNGTHIQGTAISLINPGGVTVGTASTNSSGYISATVQEGDIYTLQAYGPIDYIWPITDTVMIPTGVTAYTDSMQGHKIGAPAITTDTFMTTVTGYVLRIAGTGVKGVKVRFSLSEDRIFRDADSNLVIPIKYEAETDTTGLWWVNVPASDKLFITDPAKDTLWYSVQFSYGGWTGQIFKKIFVPDTTSVSFQKVKF